MIRPAKRRDGGRFLRWWKLGKGLFAKQDRRGPFERRSQSRSSYDLDGKQLHRRAETPPGRAIRRRILFRRGARESHRDKPRKRRLAKEAATQADSWWIKKG